MTAAPTDQAVLLLDMTTLRFSTRGGKAPLRVTTRDGVVLGQVHPRRDEKRSSMVFRALDEALKSGRVATVDPRAPRQRLVARVALYNPFSGDVAYGATPNTVTFAAAGAPLALAASGTPAVVTVAGELAELHVGERVLTTVARSVAELTRVVADHAAR